MARANSEKLPEGSFDSDRALARAVARGNDRARRELANRLAHRVRTTAHCLAPRDPDVEDYAQLAFIEILQSCGSFREESALETWAERITVRTVLRHAKRRRKHASVVTLDPTREGRDDHSGEDSLARRRVAERVNLLLGTLRKRHRVTLTLRLSLGYSVAEIAEITQVPFNTVRERLRTGRKKLSKKMEKDPVLAEWTGKMEP
jgi:RNA polymerase sigma-70 factor (ECF subfamily)